MQVHRVFCIGKNYAEHIAELGHADDGECLVFMKPASSVVPEGEPIVLPQGLGAVHHEAEMVVRLAGGGRHVKASDALAHVSHVALGLDLTLRDLQATLKKKGAPWELAKAFEGAAPLGAWTPYRGDDLQARAFTCSVNGQLRQSAQTRDMLFPVARILEILSRTWSLAEGDIIFTGTPKGVGPLAAGDEIALAGDGFAQCRWRCE